ncbi:DMT family transporter [Nitratireductor sp. ZSWI3]|uniref:DMT family transporter n=1 Tax=Nitratireductor sp. ZSWI3 TaxID=2966359 RepID=UPI0021501721|nr:DMT family transporter [Nitratireductor sp. ZSWI3]MCR4268390.1 DMT family transporter [Nitratireductor sp. ZSWI3]
MPAAAELGVERQPLIGIALKIVSVSIFVVMSSLIKSAGTVPAGQIVFYRSFFAIFPILAMLAWRRELATAFRTTRPVGHVMRGLVGVVSMGLGFFGLTRLPLPDAITLNYAQPLIVVVFSAVFMGEVVRIYRWSAVAVGFLGVVIIAWPNLSLLTGARALEAGQGVGVVAVLLAAAASAVAMLLVRKLVKTEKTATIVLWFSVTATVLALCTIPFGWEALTREQFLALAGAGVCGGVAQILMTECYRHAELSTIAPFEYTSMILAIVIGYFAFGDVPTLYTLSGGVIVIGAGLFIIWRERQLGLRRVAARRFVPPSS